MGKYVAKRLAQSAISIVLVVVAVFMLLRLMPVSGYFTREDYASMNESAREAYLASLGLRDDPFTQLVRFAGGMFSGDLGRSITVAPKTPITTLLAEKVPYSLWFGLASTAISCALGVLMGIMMARHKDRLLDHVGTAYVVAVRAIPALVYLFFLQTWLADLFGIPMIFYDDRPVTWILPLLSLSLAGVAWYAIWLRRFMVDEENRDYVKFARAKGLSSRDIARRHVFRNAIVPIVQYLPSQILLTIAGSLIIESMYSIPGMGGLLVRAIRDQDNPLVQALVLIYSTLGVVGVFLGDLLMAAVDPRIKLAGGEGGKE